MQTRQLGKSGLVVSAEGLGCMGMSEFYGATDDAQSTETLNRALDLGVTFFDTADMYGVGKNEELIGRVFQGKFDKIVIATKFGNKRNPDGSRIGIDGSPEYVRQACDASLKRLGVETIDLYYQHRVDPKTPIEETVGAMAELVKSGKVKHLGLSEASAETIRRANAVHPIAALQTEYSLWTRDVETDILPTVRELGIGFVPYSPLGRGFLTGKIKDKSSFAPDDFRSSRSPRFQGENFDRNLVIVEQIEALATEKGVTPGQIALAWVLAQGTDIVPIPGTRRIPYLEENLKALDVVLTPEDLKRIDEIAPLGVAVGTRYEEAGMAAVNI
ncbi:MAG: aldo/keto reductase [Capsulimonas sp.]|uniref:aldo/keto reductase n=1 Tax=Capsulimonas sp. TaxID=2494211 RepID=UPI003266A3B0